MFAFWSFSDLLLLQDIIRAPLNTNVDITVRQATKENMRETLKEIDKKGIRKIIAHLNTDDTYWLLKAVSYSLILQVSFFLLGVEIFMEFSLNLIYSEFDIPSFDCDGVKNRN